MEALREAVTAPLTEELRLLRQSNERLLERLEALERRQSRELEETAGATNRLADPATDQRQETYQVEQPNLFPELSQSEEVERAAELERMNAYLLGELERRRLEGEGQKSGRQWWQWWGRR